MKLENFKPKLKPGRITPHMGRIIYETESPFDQIILPMELADLLIQCNGENSVADIIEKIYRDKGSVQFKLVVRALQHLKERDFLENGEALVMPDESLHSQMQFHNLKPNWMLPIGRRVYNDTLFPTIFYVVCMFITLTSILALQNFSNPLLDPNIININGSFGFGILFFAGTASFLLSFKNIIKTLLQVFLTGRAYNFGFTFNGYAAHFTVTSDALFLSQNRFLLALFHLASFLSPLPIAGLLSFLWPDFPLLNQVYLVVYMVLLLEANPFEDSDVNQFLKAAIPDESLRRMSSFITQKPYVSLMQASGRQSDQIGRALFAVYSLVWLGFFANIVSQGFFSHINEAISTMLSGPLIERASAFAGTSMIATWSVVAIINESKLLYLSILSPLIKSLRQISKKAQFKRIDYFNQNEVLRILEGLPLFSYFPQELLNMIVQKSSVLQVQKNEPVIIQGAEGRELFILLNGHLEVRNRSSAKNYHKIGEVYPPSIFGEVAVLEDCERTAEVAAIAESIVLSVPSRVLRQAAQDNHYIRELEAFKNAIMVSQFFASAPYFRDLPENVVQLFIGRGKIENYQKGQHVFHQGDPGDGFYLVLRGSAGVMINGRPVARVGQGGFFGEISLIADIPRTGSILATQDLVILKLGRESFWEILAQDLRMAIFIESVGESRIKEDIEILRGKDAKIA